PRAPILWERLSGPFQRIDAASERAGTLSPENLTDNEARTGKKLSQWGASSRRRSYWKNRYY
ncbi:MAG: hypothetical protein KY432_07745, partial [Acidobacteria bacterium]|nr:hypothetical protein [Acidobacteriota bacterium]